jgi:uncharacterized integral membrane protein
LIRNLWVYRWLVMLAMVLGLMLWFVVINRTEVTVYFPLRFGKITSTAGVLLLLGAFAGGVVTAVGIGLAVGLRRHRAGDPHVDDPSHAELPDDRPPVDYAAKTPDGFSGAPWSAR